MSEVENVVLEHLKRFSAQMSRLQEGQEAMAADIRAIKQHMAAFMTSEFHQDADLASLKLRVERIERRLDLVD